MPEIAFLGRSNVGKSSLLNALAGTRNLARVSQTPGRTQLVNFFRVGAPGARPHDDDAMYLVDLPGYGYARVPEAMRRDWEALVSGYLTGRDTLALCVFLVDARHDPTSGDETLRAWLDHHRLPYVVAATKTDKLGRGEVARRRDALARGLGRGAVGVVAVSAETGLGIEQLWKTIRAAAPRRRPTPAEREKQATKGANDGR